MSKRRAAGTAVTKRPPKPSTGKGRVRKVLTWMLLVGLVGTLIAVGGFIYLYQTTDIPDPNQDFRTQTTRVFYSGGKTELGTFAKQNRESVQLTEMPQHLQDAVVSAEDRTFWTNKGIDPKGIVRAAFNNARGGSVQGASTITQQYVKILYLTNERSFQRKVKEAILSLKLQREMSKEHVLEDYLNTIYFGRGAYGVQAAAQAYFRIPAKRLNLKQSAFLASVLNDPTGLDPANSDSRDELEGRYRYVLAGMVKMGNLDQAEADQASARLPRFPKVAASSKYGGQRGHMLTLVRNELHALGYEDAEIDGGGLRVTTTFTPEAMAAAEQGVTQVRPTTDYFGKPLPAKQLHVAVASVEPGTGALRGFYGGQDYLKSQINWAVAGGMVGSTFKPFTLAAAIEQGFSLKDTFQGNSPYEFPDGLLVRNEGQGPDGMGQDLGTKISAVTALENSVNTAFVDMSASMDDGPAAIVKMANRLGVPPAETNSKFPGIPNHTVDLSSQDALVTLGKARISPINMANAYATLAAGGDRARVHVVEKVVDTVAGHDYTFKSPTKSVLDPDIAADVTYAMQQVVKSGTGRNALPLGRPVAGKTGTATNDDDDVSSAWFVGATPQLATAVMYVRGDGDNKLDDWLPEYFGGSYPCRTWTAVMQADLEGQPIEEFPPPVYLDGEAPSSGHAPYVPPPKPTKKPTKTAKPSSSAPPTSAPPTSEPPTSAPPTSSAPPPTDTATPAAPPRQRIRRLPTVLAFWAGLW